MSMTKEEAISLLTQVNKILVNCNSWLENTHEPLNMAFDMAIKALKGVDTSDMLYDIYMAGVNMTGEYQGCWVRFKDIERIVSEHTGEKV